MSGHDTSEETNGDGDVGSRATHQAETMLLSVDIVVGLYSEAGKHSPQTHPHNENERILLELGPRPGQAVADAHRRTAHRTCRVVRHIGSAAHGGLGAVALCRPSLRPVVWNGTGLRSVAGLLMSVGAGPITGLCSVARDATGLRSVVWVTWILWSSHPVRLPQLPGTTLTISRHQQG